MAANKILKADFLDLLFDNRNKLYGAYVLRKEYKKRLWTAVILTLFLVTGGLWILKPAGAEIEHKIVQTREVVLTSVEEIRTPSPPPPPVAEETSAPKQAKKTAAAKNLTTNPQIKKTKFTPPVIKKDVEVQETELPPLNEISTVDVVTTDGIENKDIVGNLPVVNTIEGTDNGEAMVHKLEPKKEDANRIFEKVEIQASIDMATWRRHLERNLQRYIEDAVYAGIEPGSYTVMVRFIVERDGSIAEVKALNNPGFGLAEGAVQVVNSGPKWNPGEQNGTKVRSYHTQPISFIVMDS